MAEVGLVAERSENAPSSEIGKEDYAPGFLLVVVAGVAAVHWVAAGDRSSTVGAGRAASSS